MEIQLTDLDYYENETSAYALEYFLNKPVCILIPETYFPLDPLIYRPYQHYKLLKDTNINCFCDFCKDPLFVHTFESINVNYFFFT